MRAGTMSAVICGFGRESEASERSFVLEEKRSIERAAGFSRERFANEQIRGLVRQVFFSGLSVPVRQVVFSGIEPGIDVDGVGGKVAESLAAETGKQVAVVTSSPRGALPCELEAIESVRTAAVQIDTNLWSLHLPTEARQIRTSWLKAYMEEVRGKFEYSIVTASAGESHEALAMGQAADGIILVLSALRTRRAGALRFRDALAQLRLLGTVLTDREFPIPTAIYRRL
jgi:hypothetical protein